jgi:PAS domain S-box-containing protein
MKVKKSRRSEITKGMLTKEIIENEKNFIDSVINSLPGIFYLFDQNGRFIRWNRNLEKVSGYSAEEILKMSPLDFFAGEERKLVAEKIQEVFSKEHSSVEAHLMSKDGRKIPYLFTGQLVISENKNYLVGTGIDIIERKRAEEELKKSEAKYRTLLENLPHKIFLKDKNLIWVSGNENFARDLGVTARELAGKTDYDFFPKGLADKYRADDRRIIETERTEEIEEKYIQGGKEVWVHTVKTPILDDKGNITGVLGIFWDITDHKQAEEEALRRIEWMLTCKASVEAGGVKTYEKVAQPYGDLTVLNTSRLILDSVGREVLFDIVSDHLDLLETSSAVYEKNGDYAFGIFSSGWCQFMDWTSRKSCSTPDNWEALASGKWLCHESCWNEASRLSIERNAPVDIECRGGIRLYAIPIHAGNEIIGSINIGYGNPPCDPEKLRKLAETFGVRFDELSEQAKAYETRPPFIIELAKHRLHSSARLIGEISERKQVGEALRESERKYRNIVDNALVGVYRTNLKGDILFSNDALSKMLEFRSSEEMIGKSVLTRYKNLKDREVLIEDLKKTGRVERFETELITKTGKTKNVLLNATLEGDVISVMITDITERKRGEEQIKQQLSRITALRNIDMAITASLDLRVTLNLFLEHVITQLHVDAATVLLLKPHTQTLEYGSGRGFRSAALKYTRLRLGEGHAGSAALERRIVSIPNLAEVENSFSRSPLLATEGFISYYAVPLIAKGNVKGVLEILHRAMLAPDQEWLDFLEALAIQAAIAIDNASLFDDLQRSNVELILAYDRTLEGWSKALDMRDKETEGHSQRVTDMAVKIAGMMGVSDTELVHVRRGALLHDIGKVGIPDNILLKPGPLNDEEWKIMQKHPVYAFEMLLPITFLRPALDIPYYHHEKWDGTGYPHGLKGEQIPLSARIFALVDVWDALRSPRPYRPAWAEDKVKEYIQDQAGKHFDPKVVEVFFKMEWQSLEEV